MRNFKEDMALVVEAYGLKGTVKFPFDKADEIADKPLSDFVKDPRGFNALMRGKIETAGAFINSFYELGRLRNVGMVTIRKVKNEFIQSYYATLSDVEVKTFWRKFAALNNIPQ